MIKKDLIKTLFLFCLLIILSAYGSSSNNNPVAAVQEQNVSDTDQKGETEKMLSMKIGNTSVSVDWENNNSVNALKELCKNKPLTINLHMYGGFEQVGSIGSSLPTNDKQMQATILL